MLSTSPIVFYDIAPRPPVEKNSYAPNPWKTRLALNFKGVPYSTSWVSLPDVAKVRRSLNVPACRKLADGSDFFTLPVIEDPATNSLIGDSFDIAVYLQITYPDSGAGDLFPSDAQKKLDDYAFTHDLALTVPLSECRESSEFPAYAKFNINVDAAFTAHMQLMVQDLPFEPATAELSKAEFVRRAGVSCWEDVELVGEKREIMMDSLRDMLGGMAELFVTATTTASGPFILGARASYADLIVGGWLRMMRVTLPESEWEEVRSWHGGVFGRLHDALEVYAEVK